MQCLPDRQAATPSTHSQRQGTCPWYQMHPNTKQLLKSPCSAVLSMQPHAVLPGWQAAAEPLTTKNRLHVSGVKRAPPHVHPPVHGGVHNVRLLHLLCPSGATLGVLRPGLSAWRSQVRACCK